MVAGITDYFGSRLFPCRGERSGWCVRPKNENMGVVSSHCRRFPRHDMKSSYWYWNLLRFSYFCHLHTEYVLRISLHPFTLNPAASRHLLRHIFRICLGDLQLFLYPEIKHEVVKRYKPITPYKIFWVWTYDLAYSQEAKNDIIVNRFLMYWRLVERYTCNL